MKKIYKNNNLERKYKMGYMRMNPGFELNRITRNIDNFVNDVLSPENRPRVEIGDYKPRVDIIEDEKNIYFEAELAGVSKDDVKVSVNDENILSIKGEKKFERKDVVKLCCRSERAFGTFSRSFQLPDNVDSEKVEAKYENGILYLTLPKIEPVKPKEQSIEIK